MKNIVGGVGAYSIQAVKVFGELPNCYEIYLWWNTSPLLLINVWPFLFKWSVQVAQLMTVHFRISGCENSTNHLFLMNIGLRNALGRFILSWLRSPMFDIVIDNPFHSPISRIVIHRFASINAFICFGTDWYCQCIFSIQLG